MREHAPKLLFVSLALFALLSVSLLYGGIACLKATKTPPFAGSDHMYTLIPLLPPPSNEVLIRLDSMSWRVTLRAALVIAPLTAGVLTFKAQRPFPGFALLLGWTSLAGFLGFWIWLYSAFHALR